MTPAEEATFVVFERRTQEALSKSAMIGIISGLAVLLLGIIIYFGVAPQADHTSKDMDMNQLKKKSNKAEAPAPATP